jgi:putative aldouronate transport system substrate-binding protein
VIQGQNLKFTDAEIEVLQQYKTDLESYMDEMHAKFVIGVESLSDYDDYVEVLDGFGLAKVSEVYTAAYNRYLAATK